ncbi:unnamed protein product [Bursaphelenchus xylophilus]|uniref:(pine wood nematode) hypothetical protein n=1 Tax=Bursaphelenchus xylophilus TaxID=6326 RepID=A0A1I7STB0_BURXY|nr:unnamed protein product [Bursaphelenchus xylophilus]CAG9108601.1 unnamed protein product [Bursaphelenchus xylophilus]
MVLIRSRSIVNNDINSIGSDIPFKVVRTCSLPSVTTSLNTYKTYWPSYRQPVSYAHRYYTSHSYYDDYWYNKYRYITPYWSFYRAKPSYFHVPSYCSYGYMNAVYDYRPFSPNSYYTPFRCFRISSFH